MSDLHALAEAVGLQIVWQDALGTEHRVADSSLIAILGALGFPAGDDAAIADSRQRLARDAGTDRTFVTALVDQPIVLAGTVGQAGAAELELEDGTRRPITVQSDRHGTTLPRIAELGYHQLRIDGRVIRIAVTPARCFSVADAAAGRRLWGASVQIASLRDDRATAFGDFGSLARAASAFAARARTRWRSARSMRSFRRIAAAIARMRRPAACSSTCCTPIPHVLAFPSRKAAEI